ncbi:hypothetical protein [Magnetospirillum sp. 15-1]|uniref:hypothetical protein n=1 Tax=Magnetospirillum sp. 15-1 TaxID=1979370 RepID=UPI000BBBE0F9|nr:hypothetical protein [Magnetospirillum sp. 15-1]
MNTPEPLVMSWDSDALFAKAQRYAEEMLLYTHDDWRCGLWSSFVLEVIARAALAHINPVLLAEADDRNNIYYSIGLKPTKQKFSPKSIAITDVFTRLSELIPEFVPLKEPSATLVGKRNSELHSAEAPFDAGSSSWLASFYQACDVLLQSMGHSLADLIGSEEADVAGKVVAAAKDEAAKAVAGLIKAHQTVWSQKDEEDQEKLKAKSVSWAMRSVGHVVSCPSCGAQSLLTGDPVSSPKKTIDGDVITEKQQHLPSKFQCIACGLKISGLPQLTACGIGDKYTNTVVYHAAEYYAEPDDDDYAGYDDDNNEPY